MPDKESFLAEACADIPDRRTRERVREELSAHIEDKAGEYVICGETEEEAESRAVREMGDAKRLARDLAQVNSFFPLGLFKSAVTLFYVGLIFVSFYIDIGFLDDFFLLCGTCIMFAACFLLRKGNALLCAAWVVSWCQLLVLTPNLVLYTVQPFSDKEAVQIVLTLVSAFFHLVKVCCVCFGLAACAQGKYRDGAILSGALYIFVNVVTLLTMGSAVLSVIFAVLFVVIMIFVLRGIRLAGRDLWRRDAEVRAVKTSVCWKVVLCAVMAFVFAAMPCSSIVVTLYAPKGEVYKASDIAGKDALLAERIKEETEKRYSLGEGRELLELAMRDIALSDWLEMEEILKEGEAFFGYELSSDLERLWICVCGQDRTAEVISFFRYKSRTATRAVQSMYMFENALFYGREEIKYVHLYTERGQDYFMSPSYRSYLFNWGAGEEYKIFAGRQEQRGYAAFSLVLGDYGSFSCTEQSYRQTSLFRIPFGYDFLEKGVKPSSGWKEYGGQPFKVFPSI